MLVYQGVPYKDPMVYSLFGRLTSVKHQTEIASRDRQDECSLPEPNFEDSLRWGVILEEPLRSQHFINKTTTPATPCKY